MATDITPSSKHNPPRWKKYLVSALLLLAVSLIGSLAYISYEWMGGEMFGYHAIAWSSTFPKVVMDDVQSYALANHLPFHGAADTDCYEDDTGRHVVTFDEEIPGSDLQDYMCHELFYDKGNHRTKVKVRKCHRSC